MKLKTKEQAVNGFLLAIAVSVLVAIIIILIKNNHYG